MRKIKIDAFCRDEEGRLNLYHEWLQKPFRFGKNVYASNGHLAVWRPVTRGDERYAITDKFRLKSMVDGHPGACACNREWPTEKRYARQSWAGAWASVHLFPGSKTEIGAVYRDRIARLADAAGHPVLFRPPRGPKQPVYFVCGEWLGALMPLRRP